MTTLDETRRSAERLGSRLEFETLLSNASASLLAAPPHQLEPVIERVLDAVRRFFRADRCALLSVSPDQCNVHVLLGAYSEGVPPVPPEVNLVPAFPWSHHKLLVERAPVRIERLGDLPPEASIEREIWLQMPIRSALSLPIESHGLVSHLIVLNTVHHENEWPDVFVPRLQVLGELLAGALVRRDMFVGLRETEERLASGAELAGLAHYTVNFLARTTFVDDRFREVCGVPPEREGGLEAVTFWMEQLHPADRPRVLLMRDQLHDGRLEEVSVEYRFLHPDAGERWIHHLGRVAERDADHRAVRTFGVLRDVTERKLAEAELGQLSRRLIGAHEAERALLARELHDDVTQRLAVLAIDVGRVERAAPDPAQAQAMRDIRDGLIRLSEDVHSLAYQLHPSVLEELGLAEALRAECERVGRRGPLHAGGGARGHVGGSRQGRGALSLSHCAGGAEQRGPSRRGPLGERDPAPHGRGMPPRRAGRRRGIRHQSARPWTQSRPCEHARADPPGQRDPRHRERAGPGHHGRRLGADDGGGVVTDARRPRLLLADDHLLVAEALKSLLEAEFELVGVVEDGRALVEAAQKLHPEVIVADITMPHLNGIDALVQLRQAGDDVPVVFLTMHRDVTFARRALEAGAAGFVLKHSASDELVTAIHAALKGETYITPQMAGEVLSAMQKGPDQPADPVASLTPRQREVLQLLAEGRSAKEVASSLGISARTVEFHKYQMMETLGVHTNAELVHFAIKHGLIEF